LKPCTSKVKVPLSTSIFFPWTGTPQQSVCMLWNVEFFLC